jgi:hypothetical protein
MILAGFTDLKLVVTDPFLTAVGLHRLLNLGYVIGVLLVTVIG